MEENKHKLNDKFNPKDFEDKIYENWEKKGYFKPSMDKTKDAYDFKWEIKSTKKKKFLVRSFGMA